MTPSALPAPVGVLVVALLSTALPALGQDTDFHAARAVRGERSLEVDLAYGAGRLDLGPARTGTLYQVHLRHDEESSSPRVRYRDGRLEIRIDTEVNGLRSLRSEFRPHELDVRLGPDVPVDLDLEFGAVRAELDLGGIPMSSLELGTGASETLLRVPFPNSVEMERAEFQIGAARFEGSGLGNLRARRIEVSAGVGEVTLGLGGEWLPGSVLQVEMGLGALILEIPRGLGVRIRRSGILASFEAPGLDRTAEGEWRSPGLDEARRPLEIQLDVSLGSVEVRWTDAGRNPDPTPENP